MSGAEAIAILGIISSVISIVDGTKQVYDAASNTNGLPEAFREVAARLPMVRDILDSAKRHISGGHTNKDSYKAAKDVVEDCQSKAQNLERLFQKVIPADSASRAKKYLLAVRTLGKGNRVETLMKGMFEDLQLLAIEHGMVTETGTRERVARAIEEVTALQPSLTEHATDETGFTAIHSGSGAINQVQGGQFNNPGSGHIYHAQSMNFGNNVPEDQAQSCLRALFQALRTDPSRDRNSLIYRKETRVEHTCTWITSNQSYRSWLDSCPQLLWLSGGPGKGKTMMSIFLAEELERCTKDLPDAVSLEFFCDNKNDKRNTADSIIQGLVFQLLHKRPELIKHILPTFNIQQASLFSGSSFESLWSIFENMTCDPMLQAIYCVLDGLDECDKDSIEVLLKHFKAFFSKNTSGTRASHLNLIAVSRDRPDIIQQLLLGFPRIQLDLDADTEVNKDIARFIDAKLDYIFSLRKYPQPTRAKVKNIFLERAQGTYLWIGIAAKTLEAYDAIEFETALERLPPGLDELYTRMLLDIRADHRQIAARILRWVVMAVRPLTLSELSVIIEPTTELPTGFTREDVIKKQVSYCGYFLTIEACEVNLMHQSAKDYFLRRDRDSNPELKEFLVEEKVGNYEIAAKCLQYLEDNLLASGGIDLEEETSKAFPLLSYATCFWHIHARSLSRSDDIFHLLRPFYRKNSRTRKLWLKTCDDLKMDLCGKSQDSFELLHIASRFGILPLVEKLLTPVGSSNKRKLLRSIDQKDEEGWTALNWAAHLGYLAIVRLLLEKGADVNAKGIYGRTALRSAATYGYEGVVRLLLERGVDVNAKEDDGITALQSAATYGYEGVVRLLLERGADPNAQYGTNNTVLISGSRIGYGGVVSLTLEREADINAQDGSGSTALFGVATARYDGVFRLLLELGTDINVKDRFGITVLDFASSKGEEGLLLLLVESGARIDMKKDGWETAPIQIIARYSHDYYLN